MNIKTIRKKNLRHVIKERFSNTDRQFAIYVDRNAGEISRLFSKSKNPRSRRSLGDTLAREFEQKLDLPKYWFDFLHDGVDYGEDIKQVVADFNIPIAHEFERRIESPTDNNIEPGPKVRGMVPLISWINAGVWAESPDIYAVGDAEKWLACPTSHGKGTFVLRVSGPSMDDGTANGYRDGDLIYVDPEAPTEHNDDVIVKNGNGEATFKRLVCQGNNCHLMPLNTNWHEKIIPLNEHCKIIGKVIFSGKER